MISIQNICPSDDTCVGPAALCLCGTLTSSCSQRATRVLAAAATAPGFTPSNSENTAIAQGNTHIAEVKRTRRRDLMINSLKVAVSATMDDCSSAQWSRLALIGQRLKVVT
jgi:hypothetical protein